MTGHEGNPPPSRREFMGIAGAGSLAWLASLPKAARAADGTAVDLVIFNAKAYTVDPQKPKAEALAVKAGRFAAVGSNAEIRSLVDKGTQTFDARQIAVVPGFIDCHNHAPGTTLLYETIVGNPYVVEFVTISGIVEKPRGLARLL